jgi:hypothetical protein
MATQIQNDTQNTEITALLKEVKEIKEERKKQKIVIDAISTGLSLPIMGTVMFLGGLGISFIPDDSGTCDQVGVIIEICGGIITGLGIILCPFITLCRYSIREGMDKFYQKPENKV